MLGEYGLLYQLAEQIDLIGQRLESLPPEGLIRQVDACDLGSTQVTEVAWSIFLYSGTKSLPSC